MDRLSRLYDLDPFAYLVWRSCRIAMEVVSAEPKKAIFPGCRVPVYQEMGAWIDVAREPPVLIQWITLTACLVCLAILAGCGSPEPERAVISGQVSYQGKPVEFGDIVFVPSGETAKEWEGFYCQGSIKEGRYTIDEHGPVVGLNRVEIHGYRRTGKKMLDIAGTDLSKTAKIVDALVPYIPPRFNTSSELTVEILPGENVGIDFDF